jgi:Asp-tRNA(Asn)/Glu-tRNA(Gln) amidotransferase A subunit family amidase
MTGTAAKPLCDIDAVSSLEMMRARDISPLELLDSCLERIETVNPAVNAFVAMDVDTAREAAGRAERAYARGNAEGLLLGLPLGVKDTHITGGMRTTFGSPLFADNIPKADQMLIARLRKEGAIVLGKTNTPEWAAGGNSRNPVYGATGNPFDPSRSAAGSSGGSGAALACSMVPICTGSDTGGSLRNPAAYNGIVGFRPSAGLVPSERRPLGWSCLSVDGPMARNVADTALLLAAMASDDSADPLAYSLPEARVRGRAEAYDPVAPIDLSDMRLAHTEDFGVTPTEGIIRRSFQSKIPAIAGLFGRSEAASPDCHGAHECFAILRASVFGVAHEEKCRTHPDLVGPNVHANILEARGYSLLDLAGAQEAQTRIYRGFQAFFRNHDILISPAVTVSPRPWAELYPAMIDGEVTRSYYHWLALAYVVTLSGHPAISIPVGLDEKGMPFGLQIVGPRGGDALLLRVAGAIEQALSRMPDLARPIPNFTALASAPPIATFPNFREWG